MCGCIHSKCCLFRERDLYRAAAHNSTIQSQHNVLHIQCGDGHAIPELLKKISGGLGKLYATDSSKSNISRTRRKYGQSQQLVLRRCSPLKLVIRDTKFDRVIVINPYKLWKNLNKCIQSVLKLMNKRGIFVTCFSEKSLSKQSKKTGSYRSLEVYLAVLKVEGFELISNELNVSPETGQSYITVYAFAPYRQLTRTRT